MPQEHDHRHAARGRLSAKTTTVGYASDDLTIYFGCGLQSQKARNIARDNRVSAAIDEDHENWNEIEGLSLAGIARHVTDAAELSRIESLFAAKFPQMGAFSAEDLTSLIVFRVTPSVISVLDYSKGFGRSDLVTV